MRIKTIRNISDDCQISLSTDRTKNINFIVGENTAGKTTLFNKIRSCLSNSEKNSGIELELTEKGDYETDYIFVDSYARIDELLKHLNELGLADDILVDVIKRTERMLQKIHGVFDDKKCLLKLEKGKVIMPTSLAHAPNRILYFAVLIALREQRGVELPLIADCPLLSQYLMFSKRLVQMIADNTAQALFFELPFSVTGTAQDNWWDDDAPDVSLYDDMKNNGTLGSLYVLNRDRSKGSRSRLNQFSATGMI